MSGSNLVCVSPYSNKSLIFRVGDIVENGKLAEFLLRDSPGSFVEAISEQMTFGELEPEPIDTIAVGVVEENLVEVNSPSPEEITDSDGFLEEAAQEIRDEETEPVASKKTINPAELSVWQIQQLDLSKEEWAILLEAERKGKNRSSAISFIQGKV